MIELIDELNTASSLLNLALERYMTACSALRNAGCSIPRALLDRVSCESLLAASYETKIQHARVDISQAINYSSTVVPISALPAEILYRVFHLVLGSSHCRARFLLYPDILSHVCSRWRQVAIGSCKLWSHIDFPILPAFRKGRLARAEAFAARAGQLLLHVHIYDTMTSQGYPHPNPIPALVSFLNSVAPKTRSLELGTKYAFRDYYLPILESCFANGVAGSLTQLTISEYTLYAIDKRTHGFLEAAGSTTNSRSLRLNVSHESLEDMWLPITVLRLSGLYPPWTSKIYHGLVELHLFSWKFSGAFIITESELVGILISSPQLRVLRFGLGIKDPVASNTPVLPVHLNDLEILNLKVIPAERLGIVLRWLAPGSKPLRLILGAFHDVELPFTHHLNTEVEEFISRSNVTKICVDGKGTYPWAAELLRLSSYPSLQVLALDNYLNSQSPGQVSHPDDQDSPALHPRLDRLYLLRQTVEFDQLEQMIRRYQVHELLVCNLKVFRSQQLISDEEELKRNLSHVCPTVRILTKDELIQSKDWDLLVHSGYNDFV